MERERGTPAGAGDFADESTLADDEQWPVDDHYFVEPTPGPPPAIVEEERRSSRAAAAVIVAALVLAALGLGAWFLLRDGSNSARASHAGAPAPEPSQQAAAAPTTTTSTGTTTPAKPAFAEAKVPDATGLSVDDARARLEQAGLRIRIRAHDSKAPRDQVLDESPAPGARVKHNSLVVLTVSAGPPAITVPQLVGLQAGDAARKIRALELVPRIRLVRSSRPAGAVLAQSPSSGASAQQGSSVRLEVAKNVAKPTPTVARVRVPDVVGLSASAARRKLAAAGLQATVVQVSSDQPQHTVVRQSPAAGSEMKKGAAVRVSVSSGPAQVSVPSVVGLDRQSAQAALRGAGFQVQVVTVSTTDPSQDGTVTAQDPEGGTNARDGATVTITVAQLDQSG